MAASGSALPFHVARKAVAHVDATGRAVEPSEPNAIKYERFIFDLLPEAQQAIVVEVDPAQAFAPVKNAPGESFDTPEAVASADDSAARRLAAGGRLRTGRRRGGRDQSRCLPRTPRKWPPKSVPDWA